MASVSGDRPFFGAAGEDQSARTALRRVIGRTADLAGRILLVLLVVAAIAIFVAFGAVLDDERQAPPPITASQAY